jgi:hypothetical protein
MSNVESDAAPRRPTVFLSYASEDRQVARRVGDTLPAYGLEVWYDESELGGGDAWDQKIRRQIRECDYFMPLVSAHTEARHEGYFRREWRLAVERTLDMADDHLFLLPIVIDDTDEARARVPEKFLTVQWLRVPGGQATPALEALCRRLVSPQAASALTPKKPAPRVTQAASPPVALQSPEFPRQEPGQRIRFWVEVVGWAFRSIWTLFRRLPRWLRFILIVWLAIVAMARGCTPRHHETTGLSPEAVHKLKAISDQYQGSSNPADGAKLAAQIAQEFSGNTNQTATLRTPVLAIPFAAPAGDAAAAKLADASFAQLYGRIAISQRGRVGMAAAPLPGCGLAPALALARARHASYVLCGAVDTVASVQLLTISVASVEEGAVIWTRAYPVAGADPARIAAEAGSKVPADDD